MAKRTPCAAQMAIGDTQHFFMAQSHDPVCCQS
jgi:hypothetical protein